MIPKKLAQFVMPSAETTVYVVPASTSTMLKEILVANTSASAQTISLSLVPSGATANYTNRILPDVSLGPNAMATFNFSTVMATGDFLSARASAASAVTMTISGLETPGTGTSSGTTQFASVGMVVTSTSRPTNPYNGQTIYETDTDRLMTWDGSVWEPMSIPITTSGARPTSIEGQLIYETDTDRTRVYTGSVWNVVDQVRVPNANGPLFGSAANGTSPVFMQMGTNVVATNASGDFTITFQSAFPNGLLMFLVQQGDNTHPGASFIPYNGGAALASQAVRVYTAAGAAWGNSGNMRVSWLAIGW